MEAKVINVLRISVIKINDVHNLSKCVYWSVHCNLSILTYIVCSIDAHVETFCIAIH